MIKRDGRKETDLNIWLIKVQTPLFLQTVKRNRRSIGVSLLLIQGGVDKFCTTETKGRNSRLLDGSRSIDVSLELYTVSGLKSLASEAQIISIPEKKRIVVYTTKMSPTPNPRNKSLPNLRLFVW